MMMMRFSGVSIVGLVWTAFGYSAVFGHSVGGLGLIRDVTQYAGLEQLLLPRADQARVAASMTKRSRTWEAKTRS